MAKLQIKSDKIMPFGGIFSVINNFRPLEGLIDSELGLRSALVGYQYSEIVRTMMCCYFCGGNRTEDIKIYKRGIEYMPGMKLCSQDTVLRAINELAEDNIAYKAESGRTYEFNAAEKLNRLMVRTAIMQGLLKSGRDYVLDFDHEFLAAEKYDAQFTYKKFRGYSPGAAVLTDMESGCDAIVGVENRDGNANVKFHQSDTLKRVFERIEAEGLRAKRVRCDGGSYSRDIVKTISGHCDTFYIRASMCETLRETLRRHLEWEPAMVGDQEMEVLSIPFNAFEDIRGCRLVVQRVRKPQGDAPDLFDGEWIYRAILTNDWDSTETDVIEFYNQRGAKERVFDQMDNDFGWHYLPKSLMKQNAAFLVLTALIRNFYCGLLRHKEFEAMGLTRCSRMKSFISNFLAVPAKWVRRSREYVLNLYTNREGYREIFNLGFG